MFPTSADDHYRARPAGSARGRGRHGSPSPLLYGAVIVTALIGFGLGFVLDEGSAATWAVRFAVLAGLATGFALLQRKTPHAVLVAVIAAAGLADGAALAASEPGTWPVWVMLAVNGIQAGSAVVALLSTRDVTQQGTADQYAAYMEYYNEAARQYYDQQQYARAATTDHRRAHDYHPATGQSTVAPEQAQYAAYADVTTTATTPLTHEPGRSAETQTVVPTASVGATPSVGMPAPERSAAVTPPWHVAEHPQRATGE